MKRGLFGPAHAFGTAATYPSYVAHEGYRDAADGVKGITLSESYKDFYVPIGGFQYLCLVKGCPHPIVGMSPYNAADPSSGVRFSNFIDVT